MFTEKDRKIANQKAMIENRDKFIDKLSQENIEVHNENKDLRFENKELRDTLKEILRLGESNTYNNDKMILGKIKELAKTAINN